MSIELSKFRTVKSVLELRYPTNFLLWDRVGSFWTTLLENSSEPNIKAASPNNTTVQIGHDIEASVAIDKSTIVCAYPGTDLAKLRKLAGQLVPELVHCFSINTFQRIGLRTFYHLSFPDKEAASDYVFSNSSMPRVSGRHLNVEGSAADPEMSFRFEDGNVGFIARLSVKQVNVEVELPMELREEDEKATSKSKTDVVVDLDYYVGSKTETDMVNIDEMIKTWSHVQRRDLGKLFDGG